MVCDSLYDYFLDGIEPSKRDPPAKKLRLMAFGNSNPNRLPYDDVQKFCEPMNPNSPITILLSSLPVPPPFFLVQFSRFNILSHAIPQSNSGYNSCGNPNLQPLWSKRYSVTSLWLFVGTIGLDVDAK